MLANPYPTLSLAKGEVNLLRQIDAFHAMAVRRFLANPTK